jgi:hypothetical protein
VTSRPHTCWKRKGLPIAGSLLVVAGAGFVIYQGQKPASSPNASSFSYLTPDLQDPAISFDTLRYTADTGGNENTRAQSIVWLDQQTRTMQPLSPRQEAWMLDMLTAGGHPEWPKDFKFWVFNSAFNTLHLGPRQADLSKLLANLAVHDPEKTMRLYALQHLEVQRTNGRLTGALADEIRSMLLRMVAAPNSEEAGLALRFLAEWDGLNAPAQSDIINQSLRIAADNSRSVDIRVTAIHASGSAALDLARTMASDATQPVLVRKAAIALIGNHGGESDMANLQKLSAESSRLAQAADPATQAIRHRLSNTDVPALIPF